MCVCVCMCVPVCARVCVPVCVCVCVCVCVSVCVMCSFYHIYLIYIHTVTSSLSRSLIYPTHCYEFASLNCTQFCQFIQHLVYPTLGLSNFWIFTFCFILSSAHQLLALLLYQYNSCVCTHVHALYFMVQTHMFVYSACICTNTLFVYIRT